MLKQRFILVALAAMALPASATDCGMRAAKMLAEGKTRDLNALFVTESKETRQALASLAGSAGKLTRLSLATGPRFSKHLRRSVQGPDIKAYSIFNGVWVDAASSSLGPVQLLVAVKPSTKCQVLALHLDTPA